MRKSKLLKTKAVIIFLACTMIVGSTGITTLAETGHTAYENIKECNVTVEVEDSNEIVSAEEESSNTMYNNVEECDIPVAVEEVAETNDIVYAGAESELVTYKLYNNKSYEIVNNAEEAVDIITEATSKTRYDFYKKSVSGNYEIKVSESSLYERLPKGFTLVISTKNEDKPDGYTNISVPKGVVIREYEEPALKYCELKLNESCKVTCSKSIGEYNNAMVAIITVCSDGEIHESVHADLSFKTCGEEYAYTAWNQAYGSIISCSSNTDLTVSNIRNGDSTGHEIENAYVVAPNIKDVIISNSDTPALYHFIVKNGDTITIYSDMMSRFTISATYPDNNINNIVSFVGTEYTYDEFGKTTAAGVWYFSNPLVNCIFTNKDNAYKCTVTVSCDNADVIDLAIPYELSNSDNIYIEKREANTLYKVDITPSSSLEVQYKDNDSVELFEIKGFGENLLYRKTANTNWETIDQYGFSCMGSSNNSRIQINASNENTGNITCYIPYDLMYNGSISASLNGKELVADKDILGVAIVGNKDKFIENLKNNNEMVTESDGKKYWYENGIKQGTEGRGKEIYDPSTDAWYWLDAIQGGAVATSKDVYQESNGGKWVRYDENGHMIKGWDTNENGKYYFDPITGAMSKGEVEIDGQVYCFNADTGIICNNEFFVKDGNRYWYENGIRQGTVGRGKEIYDPATNAWYWLDSIDGGKVATGKDLYQESAAGEWAEDKTTGTGKWVRYDENGYMVKGWYTNENGTYYFDLIYGTMAKGTVSIDGTSYYFNETTGILQ